MISFRLRTNILAIECGIRKLLGLHCWICLENHELLLHFLLVTIKIHQIGGNKGAWILRRMNVQLGEGPDQYVAHLLLDLGSHYIHGLQILALGHPVVSLETAALAVGLRIGILEQFEKGQQLRLAALQLGHLTHEALMQLAHLLSACPDNLRILGECRRPLYVVHRVLVERLELALLLVVGIQALAGIDDDVVPPLSNLLTTLGEVRCHLFQAIDPLGEFRHILGALANYLALLLVPALLVRLVNLGQLRL